jgi:hypothetical protein
MRILLTQALSLLMPVRVPTGAQARLASMDPCATTTTRGDNTSNSRSPESMRPPNKYTDPAANHMAHCGRDHVHPQSEHQSLIDR